jgi:hypothetical protein
MPSLSLALVYGNVPSASPLAKAWLHRRRPARRNSRRPRSLDITRADATAMDWNTVQASVGSFTEIYNTL